MRDGNVDKNSCSIQYVKSVSKAPQENVEFCERDNIMFRSKLGGAFSRLATGRIDTE